MDPRIADAWARLPDYFGNHVLVSITALALGLGISLPLAVAALGRPRLRTLLLAATSIVQTIPGLALLALFYPVLLGAAALSERTLGVGFSALGFLPAVLALALYSMLPVVRNTITGIEGIDPAIKQAAQGVGMTARQSLTMVELPLALPVIMAGVRTAAVWVIGTATLSTPIGQTSLGNYIFTGLQTQNWIFVLFGCVAAAVLALAVDQFLSLIENGYTTRRRSHVAAGGIGLSLVVLLALIPSLSAVRGGYVIGAKPFAEQYILVALMEDRLRAQGLTATRRDGLGLRRHLRCAGGRRYRCLRRIFGHPVGEPDAAHGRAAARSRCSRRSPNGCRSGTEWSCSVGSALRTLMRWPPPASARASWASAP